jgi:hypothetical protein
MQIMTCPADRCSTPAEALSRWEFRSTDGPIEHVKTIRPERPRLHRARRLGDLGDEHSAGPQRYQRAGSGAPSCCGGGPRPPFVTPWYETEELHWPVEQLPDKQVQAARNALRNLDAYFPQAVAHSRHKPGPVAYRESEAEQSLACMSAGQGCFAVLAEGVGFEPTRTVTSSSGFKTRQSTCLTCVNAVEDGSSGTYSA